MDGKASEVGDPTPPVGNVEAHHAGGSPVAVDLDLDHEAAAFPWLRLRELDLLEQRLAVARPHGCEIGLDLLVRGQLEQEVDVVGARAPQAKAVAGDRLGHGAVATAARRGRRSTPE